ncbi:indolepyruvate ferredoxin oxidoreductase beta subunit [Marinitoga hydrogenitolerans DSM 16785]|uniref:Indolepyruvate ferredoxin oxidoreductase beta subunit n=1 Tax=Marinitoga hydrogenitolerans (strain DSM 16785 / JCM 12826 / AT1271) TaxID=1122195 RepID=A0A1M4WBY1_MARH1|nr:2-oxoacid:acceptor oxidoreductase family protein [Marinitoga hydrogenitolerans]SHE78472.1 indolepyruvate ferredoxin oxidoreductase beta subunit [Marinitoga hydrogenitolerans DSM 16785]
MKAFNIYLIGVGGQGIGLLSEVVIRAADKSNLNVRGVDTHGLAQRGGTVSSNIRIGDNINSPLIMKGKADLVIALERHEALRGMNEYSKDSSTVIYYDAVWQPLDVRLRRAKEIDNEIIQKVAKNRNINLIRVFLNDLKDARMQNMAVLATMAKYKLIPQINKTHYLEAINDLLSGDVLKKNIKLFERVYNN